jgi:hypothetical protein
VKHLWQRAGCALIAVGLLCACSPQSGTTDRTVAVRPVDVILVSHGGSAPPSGEYTELVVGCDEDLRAGRDQECLKGAQAAQLSNDPAVRSTGEVLAYIAETNLGLDTVSNNAAVEDELSNLDDSASAGLKELFYRSAAVRYARSGDAVAADNAVREALKIAPPQRADAIRAERCRAGGGPSCSGGTPAPTSTEEPTTTVDPKPTPGPTETVEPTGTVDPTENVDPTGAVATTPAAATTTSAADTDSPVAPATPPSG